MVPWPLRLLGRVGLARVGRQGWRGASEGQGLGRGVWPNARAVPHALLLGRSVSVDQHDGRLSSPPWAGRDGEGRSAARVAKGQRGRQSMSPRRQVSFSAPRHAEGRCRKKSTFAVGGWLPIQPPRPVSSRTEINRRRRTGSKPNPFRFRSRPRYPKVAQCSLK
jgi:hypothetical protein